MFNYHTVIAIQLITWATMALALVSIAVSLRKKKEK